MIARETQMKMLIQQMTQERNYAGSTIKFELPEIQAGEEQEMLNEMH